MVSNVDVMHYETRAIRDALKASNSRLASAKIHVASNLTPTQDGRMEFDWIQPCVHVGLEDGDTLASGDPKFQDLRRNLLDFEKYSRSSASTKERAFYSALRTLLSEAVSETNAEQRSIKITAANSWFYKNRPGPTGEAPAISAALAASLSINPPAAGGANAQAPNVAGGPGGRQGSPTRAMTGAAPLSNAASLDYGKGRHDFFALYSSVSRAALKWAATPIGAAAGADGGNGLSSEVAASARIRRGMKEGSASVARCSVEVPIVWQPSVSGVYSSKREGALSPSRATTPTAGSALVPTSQRTMHRSMGTSEREGSTAVLFVPRAKARAVVFDPYNMDAGPGASASQRETNGGQQQRDGNPTAWVSGLNKSQSFSTAQDKARVQNEELECERKEVAALRLKWTTIDQQIAAADANVEAQIQQWSHQRARLEEEIVRRQEASRFGAPAARAQAGLAGQGQQAGGMSGQSQGYLSPYVGFTTDKVGTQDGLPYLPGLLPSTDVTAVAREVRQSAQEEFEFLSDRIREIGVGRAIQGSRLEHALAPIPDKPFLECIAKLPRPGDSLVSRPDSVPQPKKGKSTRRKKSKK